MKKINDTTIALLIDGDNAAPKRLAAILEEVSKQGTITIRRIYGDWTTSGMTGWKDLLNANAIQPVQQFAYTKGKNSTDSALIIDAMDILHGELVDAFCIVSSDSDYTRLATRLRESGLFVMGVGEKKTPDAFVKACERFIYVENLEVQEQGAGAGAGAGVTTVSSMEVLSVWVIAPRSTTQGICGSAERKPAAGSAPTGTAEISNGVQSTARQTSGALDGRATS